MWLLFLYLSGVVGLWVITFIGRTTRAVAKLEEGGDPITTRNVEWAWYKVKPLIPDSDGDSLAFVAGIGWPVIAVHYFFRGAWWFFVKVIALSRKKKK